MCFLDYIIYYIFLYIYISSIHFYHFHSNFVLKSKKISINYTTRTDMKLRVTIRCQANSNVQ